MKLYEMRNSLEFTESNNEGVYWSFAGFGALVFHESGFGLVTQASFYPQRSMKNEVHILNWVTCMTFSSRIWHFETPHSPSLLLWLFPLHNFFFHFFGLRELTPSDHNKAREVCLPGACKVHYLNYTTTDFLFRNVTLFLPSWARILWSSSDWPLTHVVPPASVSQVLGL